MQLKFGKNALLRSTAIGDRNDPICTSPLICHDDLKFVSILDRLKLIELDRLFVLNTNLLADEDEAAGGIPRFVFPACFEEIFLLKPTAMPSAWRPVLNTEPSKSRVTRESLSFVNAQEPDFSIHPEPSRH